MALFFAYQRLRALLRVALPMALGVDMVHSFYYVGRLIQEKRSIEAEKERRRTLYATTVLFKKVSSISASEERSCCQVSRDCNETDFSFWPEAVRQRIQTVPLPDMSSVPRPSYELDDDEEDVPSQEPQPSRAVHRLKEWSPSGRTPSPSSGTVPPDGPGCEQQEREEDEIIGTDGEESSGASVFRWDVSRWIDELYKLVVPFPLRHPFLFAHAVQTVVSRELRLHLKKSDGYLEARGAWLRTVLHVPYVMFERRSALRFRVRLVPSP